MANANVLYQLNAQANYERDGFSKAVGQLARWAGQNSEMADNLILSRGSVGAKADIVTNAGVKIYMVSVASPAGATTTSYLQVFNTSSASVTLGTTVPEEQFRLEAGVTKTVLYYVSNDSATMPTAFSWAATTTVGGATAANATNLPTVTILYRPA